ncbi:MAG: AAA family ATPase [Candidatus Micrarchaeaceae archaeon]
MAGDSEEQKTEEDLAKEHWRSGNAFFQEGKFQEAKEEYTSAIKIKEDYADAYFNRALTERVLNEFMEAMRDLEKVMELQPNSHDAPFIMGDIAESRNDIIGARYWYEKSLANNPDFSEAKKKLEEIDMKMHMGSHVDYESEEEEEEKIAHKGAGRKVAQAEDTDVITEGQIKKVAFYKSNIKFDSVIGSKKVKEYLQDNVVLAIQHPELFKKYGKKLGVGLLLYGPPGTGKTYMVNAIAGEAGANVIIARINQIVDMYTGNTEKNIHAIFQQARENTPCIIFFDELDALGIKRGGGSPQGESSSIRLAVNQFLVEMNGVESNPEGIFVIGATNQPWDIDPALKRSGRFGDSLYIPPPKYRERVELFKFYTKNKPRARLNYGRLARATAGYTPADIERICDKAAMRPLLHEHKFNKERKLTMGDLLAILKDKDMSGSTLDEWYGMVKKDVISSTETQIVDGKKQVIVKEGKLDPQEKVLYKPMVKDIKRNTNEFRMWVKKFTRWFAVHLF